MEAKKLIRGMIKTHEEPIFSFQTQSPRVSSRFNEDLVSAVMIKGNIHKQLVSPYLTKKLRAQDLE